MLNVFALRILCVLAGLALFVSGCAYHFGLAERKLPGGYSQLAIPVFKNKSGEVGIEPIFTNALIRRFARSQVANVTDRDSAPVTLEGTILKVDTVQGALQDSNSLHTLPTNAVLVTQYRLVVQTKLTVRRKSDDKILWEGTFSNEKVYNPPQIGTPVVNSANATYNQSARTQTLSLLAEDMMAEAHDRITENF